MTDLRSRFAHGRPVVRWEGGAVNEEGDAATVCLQLSARLRLRGVADRRDGSLAERPETGCGRVTSTSEAVLVFGSVARKSSEWPVVTSISGVTS